MNFSLNEFKIKRLCGMVAYKKGKVIHQAGKILLEPDSEDDLSIKATIEGRDTFQISVRQTQDGEIVASCSCPPVGFVTTYCHHIAGVLLAIEENQQRENPMTAKMLDLFTQQAPRPRGNGFISIRGRFSKWNLAVALCFSGRLAMYWG